MSWMADIAFSTKNSFADRVRQSVARFLLGGIGLALVTLLSSRFELRSGVASLFYLIPVVALLVCESVVWFSSMTAARKTGWMLFTLFAILLQIGILFAIITMATGYVPTR